MPYKDKQAQLEYQRRWMQQRRADAIAERGGYCTSCGSTDGLEFHHRNREEKTSHRIWSWSEKRRNEELAKCDLLCKKCHDAQTAQQFGYHQYEHGTELSYHKAMCRCQLCRDAHAKAMQIWRNTRKRAA